MSTARITRIAAVGGALLAATPLAAQRVGGLRPVSDRAFVGGGITVLVPDGPFEQFVDAGGGLSGHAVVGASGFGLRFDGAFVIYGYEVDGYPWPLSSTSYLFNAGVGPQLTLGAGPIRPYGYGGIGFSYFATAISDGYVSATEFDDFTDNWYAGGGLRMELSRGAAPLSLDLGARYVANGRVRYVAGAAVAPGGYPAPAVVETEANFVLLQFGLSVALP